jgi:peptidyl-tRNA hydrolase, PTH1 family
MKYLITGLGNIGYEYEGTRHNIGFEVVDQICKSLEGTWRQDTHGDLAEVRHKGRTLILLKPNTYMNLSGKAVRYWLQKEKIPNENLLVVTDDLNLPFGKIRMRMGIGSDFGKGKQVNFVLGKWSEDERAELPHILERADEATRTFATIGLDRAMNLFNK